jgi:hypothetical protein
MGDYDQAVADNNYFYTTWGDNRLSDAFHANQPDVRFTKIPVDWTGTDSSLAASAGVVGASASRPAAADSTPFVAPSVTAAAPVAGPGALLSRGAAGQALAVDAFFVDLARTSQATSSVLDGDTAPRYTIGLAAPSLPVVGDLVTPPSARGSGRPTPALARQAAFRPTDDWGTDVMTLADPSWDGEAATWPAR